jgi:hypothetical protein
MGPEIGDFEQRHGCRQSEPWETCGAKAKTLHAEVEFLMQSRPALGALGSSATSDQPKPEFGIAAELGIKHPFRRRITLPNPMSGHFPPALVGGRLPHGIGAEISSGSMQSRFSVTCLLLASAVAPLCADAQSRRYFFEIESAVVEYQTTASFGTGEVLKRSDTLWFDGAGKRAALLSKQETSRSGMAGAQREYLLLLVGDRLNAADMRRRTGMSIEFRDSLGAPGAVRLQVPLDLPRPMVREYVEQKGGRFLPADTVLGHTCQVFELSGSKTWTYKGVVLRSEGTVGGATFSTVATRFAENSPVPADRFAPPSGIVFRDTDDVAILFDQSPEQTPPPTAVVPGATTTPAPAASPSPAPVVAQSLPLISEADFRALAGKLHVHGHTVMAPEPLNGGYTVNLVDTHGGAMVVAALPIGEEERIGKDPAFRADSKFQYNGRTTVAGVLARAGESPRSLLLIRYPERRLALLISSVPQRPRERLLELLDQIDL